MKTAHTALTILLFITTPTFLLAEVTSTPDDSASTAFILTQSVELPVTCGEAFDAMTGDISGWWDHSFSGNSYKLYIEPHPGGSFMEEFNEKGDGV